jgi:lipoprotein-anchoring transpeptidase ErfK/SrfK
MQQVFAVTFAVALALVPAATGGAQGGTATDSSTSGHGRSRPGATPAPASGLPAIETRAERPSWSAALAAPPGDSLVSGTPADTAGAGSLPRVILLPTRADSLASKKARAAATRSIDLRVVISLAGRQLWVLRGGDTVRTAPVGLAEGWAFSFDGKSWTFKTPPGRRRVQRKEADPVWIPPDWHYAERAHQHGFRLKRLSKERGVTLSDGRRLVVRGDEVGLVDVDSVFAPLPPDEEIIFDSTLYVPPYGTKNRRIVGELGRYRLDLGQGYLLHGTPYQNSIGTATTHGCIRLRDDDIEWLYRNVSIGTPVFIY